MNANELSEKLQLSPLWVREVAVQVYPSKFGGFYETTKAKFYEEVTLRVTQMKTAKRSGKRYEGKQRRRVDLVAFVQAHFKKYEPIAVGVEIKVDKHDLLNDNKIADYLPYFHLFYLAVPLELRDLALKKADPLNVGVLVVGSSVSQIKPSYLQEPADAPLRELYAELLLRPVKQERKRRA